MPTQFVELTSSLDLTTALSQSIIDLANMLSMSLEIPQHSAYLYMHYDGVRTKQIIVKGQPTAMISDVVTSNKVFTEILLDIAVGMSQKEAFLKQGYIV